MAKSGHLGRRRLIKLSQSPHSRSGQFCSVVWTKSRALQLAILGFQTLFCYSNVQKQAAGRKKRTVCPALVERSCKRHAIAARLSATFSLLETIGLRPLHHYALACSAIGGRRRGKHAAKFAHRLLGYALIRYRQAELHAERLRGRDHGRTVCLTLILICGSRCRASAPVCVLRLFAI